MRPSLSLPLFFQSTICRKIKRSKFQQADNRRGYSSEHITFVAINRRIRIARRSQFICKHETQLQYPWEVYLFDHQLQSVADLQLNEPLSSIITLSLIASLGPRPGTQYYVLLCDSNRHRIWILETRERSCCSRDQRQLQRRWAPKGLHRILIQLQQLPSLPSLEWIKTNQVPQGVRASFRFSSTSLSSRRVTMCTRRIITHYYAFGSARAWKRERITPSREISG